MTDTYRTEMHLNWWGIGLTALAIVLVLCLVGYFVKRRLARAQRT